VTFGVRFQAAVTSTAATVAAHGPDGLEDAARRSAIAKELSMRKPRFVPSLDVLPSRIAPTVFVPPIGPSGSPTPPPSHTTTTTTIQTATVPCTCTTVG